MHRPERKDIRCVAACSRGAADRAERRTSRSGARREVSDGAKQRTAHVVSTTRRLDNGDDGRLGRRRYCFEVVRGGAPGTTTIASDDGSGEKQLWL